MKFLTKIYILLTIILLLDLTLYLTSEISLASKLADQILFWLWFILTFVVIFGQIRKRWTKIYGMTLIVLTFLSLIPMGVPFLTIIAFMIPDPNPQYFYRDKDIRVELTTKSVIGKPYIAVVENHLVFEREIAELEAEYEIEGDYFDVNDIKSVYRRESLIKNRLILNFDFGKKTIQQEIKN
jgi:hypothetical protein